MADTVEVLVTEFRADIKRFEASMRKQARVAEDASIRNRRAFERANRRIAQSTDEMSRDVRRAIAAIAVGSGTRSIASYADAWVDLNNKIAAAGVVANREGRGVLALAEEARTARQEIEPYADLYARLLRSSSDIAESEAEVAKATNLAARAFKAGGASAQEQAAGILQLGQALGSGFLQGDELRSIRENAPLVAKAIADAMNVSIGELKKLGAEGKLTSDIVFRALLSAEADIEQAFGATVPRATDNAVLAFDNLKLKLGEFSEQTGLVRVPADALAEAINFVADNVDLLADAVIVAGAAVTGALGAQVLVGVATSLSRLAVGATAAAQAMTLLRGASAFMFGPAGLIIGAGALAGTLAYLAINSDKAAVGSKELADATSEAAKALREYEEAIIATNGLTGTALTNAENMATAKRLEAIATLEAAQAERQLSIERAKSELRKERDRRVIRRLGSSGVEERVQASNVRELANEVAELERQAREAENQISRLVSGRYKEDFNRTNSGSTSSRRTSTDTSGSDEALNEFLKSAKDTFAEAIKAAEDQVELEISMLDKLRDARDEMHGRQLAITDREYERRRMAIENEIKDEERKQEALALLAEERAEYERQLQEQVSGGSGNPEIDRIRQQEEERLAFLTEMFELERITREKYEQEKIDLAKDTEEQLMAIRAASTQFQIAAGEKLFGSLSDLAREFAGDQSGVYKTLFAIEKAFSIASSLIAIQTGVAQALSLPFPANLGAAATVAAAGASVVANIRSVTADGFADGVIGLRGPGTGRSDSIPAFLSRGESVITASGTAQNASLLSAINSGANVQAAIRSGAVGGGRVVNFSAGNFIVEGNLTDDVYERVQADLARRDARFVDEVNRVLDRSNTISTPRHMR